MLVLVPGCPCVIILFKKHENPNGVSNTKLLYFYKVGCSGEIVTLAAFRVDRQEAQESLLQVI